MAASAAARNEVSKRFVTESVWSLCRQGCIAIYASRGHLSGARVVRSVYIAVLVTAFSILNFISTFILHM
jgi:hypothetical protein